MSSNDIQNKMEEKHFELIGQKSKIGVNNKSVTNEFLDSETGKQITSKKSPLQNLNQEDLEVNGESNEEKSLLNGEHSEQPAIVNSSDHCE